MPVSATAILLGSTRPWLFCGLLVCVFAALARRGTPGDVHKRGARVLSGRRRSGRPGARVSLAGVGIQPLEETKHFKLIGTTGTGKSTAIASLLAGALARGDRAVITDPDGGYLRRFYDRRRGDVILNPFEPRSVKWDPFAEVQASWDIEQLVMGLIPSTEDAAAREWRGYARTFLSALLRRCWSGGGVDIAELWRLLTVAAVAELRPVVAGSPAQPFLDPENTRMFASIRSVAVSAAAALEYVTTQRARSFSVRRWVRDGRGVLSCPMPPLRSPPCAPFLPCG